MIIILILLVVYWYYSKKTILEKFRDPRDPRRSSAPPRSNVVVSISGYPIIE